MKSCDATFEKQRTTPGSTSRFSSKTVFTGSKTNFLDIENKSVPRDPILSFSWISGTSVAIYHIFQCGKNVRRRQWLNRFSNSTKLWLSIFYYIQLFERGKLKILKHCQKHDKGISVNEGRFVKVCKDKKFLCPLISGLLWKT